MQSTCLHKTRALQVLISLMVRVCWLPSFMQPYATIHSYIQPVLLRHNYIQPVLLGRNHTQLHTTSATGTQPYTTTCYYQQLANKYCVYCTTTKDTLCSTYTPVHSIIMHTYALHIYSTMLVNADNVHFVSFI